MTQDTPLTISSNRGRSEVVRVLLEAGANINHQTKVRRGPREVEVTYSKCSKHLNVYMYICTLQNKATPLMCAALEGHTDVVQVLLSRQDVDINMRDKVR